MLTWLEGASWSWSAVDWRKKTAWDLGQWCLWRVSSEGLGWCVAESLSWSIVCQVCPLVLGLCMVVTWGVGAGTALEWSDSVYEPCPLVQRIVQARLAVVAYVAWGQKLELGHVCGLVRLAAWHGLPAEARGSRVAEVACDEGCRTGGVYVLSDWACRNSRGGACVHVGGEGQPGGASRGTED